MSFFYCNFVVEKQLIKMKTPQHTHTLTKKLHKLFFSFRFFVVGFQIFVFCFRFFFGFKIAIKRRGFITATYFENFHFFYRLKVPDLCSCHSFPRWQEQSV